MSDEQLDGKGRYVSTYATLRYDGTWTYAGRTYVPSASITNSTTAYSVTFDSATSTYVYDARLSDALPVTRTQSGPITFTCSATLVPKPPALGAGSASVVTDGEPVTGNACDAPCDSDGLRILTDEEDPFVDSETGELLP